MPFGVPDTSLSEVPRGTRGSILVTTVLLTCLVTTVLTAAAYRTSLRVRARHEENDGASARAYAVGALEAGVRRAADLGDWRNTITTDTWVGDYPFGDGAFFIRASDPTDGIVLANGVGGSASTDTLLMEARATCGDVERAVAARYVPLPHPATASAIFADDLVTLQGGRIEGDVRANSHVTDPTGTAVVVGDITTVTGSTVSPILDDGDTDVFYEASKLVPPYVTPAWFQAVGEEITLPADGGLRNVTITPESNPYGSPNPEGIYWIDGGGGTITLEQTVIVACLAIVNVSDVLVREDLFSTSDPGTSFYLRSPEPERLPALVVDGRIDMAIHGGEPLSYELGGQTHYVTSEIVGVIYASDRFRGPQKNGSGSLEMSGAIIASEVQIWSTDFTLRHDPALNTSALVELESSELRPVPGTLQDTTP